MPQHSLTVLDFQTHNIQQRS